MPTQTISKSPISALRRWFSVHPFLVAFVGLYVLGFGAAAVSIHNTEFVLYTIALLIEIGIVLTLDARFRLSGTTLWCLAIWGLLHMAGGTIAIPESVTDGDKSVLYALRLSPYLPRYDQLIHSFGFFAATLTSAEALAAGARAFVLGPENPSDAPRELPRLPFSLAVAAALMGAGLGALNEVIEFFISLTVPGNGVGGYVNTGWDLVSNSIGALTAGTLCWTRWLSRPHD